MIRIETYRMTFWALYEVLVLLVYNGGYIPLMSTARTGAFKVLRLLSALLLGNHNFMSLLTVHILFIAQVGKDCK